MNYNILQNILKLHYYYTVINYLDFFILDRQVLLRSLCILLRRHLTDLPTFRCCSLRLLSLWIVGYILERFCHFGEMVLLFAFSMPSLSYNIYIRSSFYFIIINPLNDFYDCCVWHFSSAKVKVFI